MPPLRMLHLLMLMVLLCDADGTCPTEHNPLVLDPSEVISEYGSEVFLNCSSSHEDHDGMYWSNAESEMTVDDTFIPWTVTLSDWNVTAKCIIKMNASFDCSKDLEITLYKNPDMVSLFPLSYSVEETQYVLQCDVHDVAPVQNLTVKWYKDNEMIRTESFPNRSKTPVTESPQLIANVSRGDTGAKFRCEAQLDFGPNGPKLPIISATVVIFAQYAPELSDNTTDVYMSLTEGDNVTLSCDAEGNPPPHFHWTRDGVNMMENTMNLSVTQVNVSANYTCTASNHLGRTNKSIFIHVIKDVMGVPAVVVTTPVPRKVCPLTLTPGEVVVRFGDRASVNCSTSATDVSGISWEASVGGTGSENPPSFTWTVEKLQDWSLKPKCYITLRNNHRCFVEPNIKLYKTPDVVSVSAGTQGPMVEGVQYLLRCDIISVAPVLNLRVMWSMGEENYDEEMFNDTSVTPVNKTSLLRVTPTRDHNGALFRCHAELLLGPKGPNTIPTISSEPYTAVVHFAPEFREGNYSQEVTPGQNVTFACSAEGNPVPEIQWNFPAVENVRETTGGRQKNVSVTGATSTNAGVYICVATNKVGSVSRSVTLRMRGHRGRSLSILWWLLILCFLTLLLIVMITLCKRRKKHGQYSFISPAEEGSGIPLTETSGGDKA
ncbi:vascular cell adhesion protein 1-like isoform X3 [Hippoglossus hippoglossus]|uniref:vascular cell adhesion protein 1-like isoform X3 n=1 Tax=Hippoglossus hippoglossus TaxID=8267 RepID=UPI00148D61AD|nr:vascular cell adhesion protein 1-like isoform X3 [Hippoglossus hippoglossus]